jgi:hypothetical protein
VIMECESNCGLIFHFCKVTTNTNGVVLLFTNRQLTPRICSLKSLSVHIFGHMRLDCVQLTLLCFLLRKKMDKVLNMNLN